jgi:YVTN family beta-propeller protein
MTDVIGRLPLALLAASCFFGCSKTEHKATPAIPATPLAYVSDEAGGNVAVVDVSRAEVVASIPVGKRPRGVKLSPDRKLLYVALSGSPRGGPGVDESKLPPPDRSADGIAVVDVATRKVLKVIPSGQDPETFDIAPDGKTLYVSNEETAELTAVELPSGRISGTAHVGREPEGVTVRPDGKAVYVTSEQDGEVTALDPQTLVVTAHMPAGPRPRSVVFARDGVTAFVTDEMGGKLTVLDTQAKQPVGEIPLHEDSPTHTGPRPMGAVLSPDGKLLYVSCGRGGSVAIVDTATRKQVRSLDGVGDRPWGIALSRDGLRLYTANGPSLDLSIIDVATGNVDRRVHIGGLPWGVALAD